jgi:hypothetical protein
MKTVFSKYMASHSTWVTQNPHVALPSHPRQSVQVWPKSVCSEGHFTLEVKTVFQNCLASHSSCVTQTSNVALPHLAPPPKFGRNRAVKKGTLFYTSKQFSFPISPPTEAGRFNLQMWHSLPCSTTHGNLLEIGQYRQALYSWGRNSFSLLFSIALLRGDSNTTCGTPLPYTTSSASSVKIGQ